MQQSLHLRRIGSRICSANSFACDVAGEVVQFQSDCQSLFARHLTITTNLFFQRGSRIHNLSIVYLRFADNCRNQPKIERGGDKQVGEDGAELRQRGLPMIIWKDGRVREVPA